MIGVKKSFSSLDKLPAVCSIAMDIQLVGISYKYMDFFYHIRFQAYDLIQNLYLNQLFY